MQSYEIIFGEQKTDEWFELRNGVAVTGSIAKKVKGTGNAYLYEHLAMITTDRQPKDLSGIAHVDRGVELEPEARKAYEKKTKEKVEQVAFIRSGRYGISPDGVIIVNHKGAKKVIKLVEIKCPDTNNHIRYILEDKIPAEHMDQIIHGFIVCGDVDEIDFVSYCPIFKFNPLVIKTVKRSDLFLDIATTKVTYEKFVEKLDKSRAKLIL